MAPISLQPHSCGHCGKCIIDEWGRRNKDYGEEDRREEKDFVHFDCTLSDISIAHADGCSFCTWLLDKEWIHRSATVDKILAEKNLPEDHPYRGLLDALAEASIRRDGWLPPPNPVNPLRRYIAEDGEHQLGALRLVCFFYRQLEIRFCGLWDTVACHIVVSHTE
jgi:hypothetical protein